MTQPRKSTQQTGEHPVQVALEASIEELRSKDGFVRKAAREALTSVGQRAVTPLLLLLKDPVDNVRWEAAKALVTIADVRAVPGFVVALEDRMFGVRWLAAEGLIAIGVDALAPLLKALMERSDSVWLRGGAHHVFHDLARGNLENLLAPVTAALDGMDPQVGVIEPASNALHELRG
jgi:HEAT repeat protein